MWFIGVEVVVHPPKKILDPPLALLVTKFLNCPKC